jgi:hypothetical protein
MMLIGGAEERARIAAATFTSSQTRIFTMEKVQDCV